MSRTNFFSLFHSVKTTKKKQPAAGATDSARYYLLNSFSFSLFILFLSLHSLAKPNKTLKQYLRLLLSFPSPFEHMHNKQSHLFIIYIRFKHIRSCLLFGDGPFSSLAHSHLSALLFPYNFRAHIKHSALCHLKYSVNISINCHLWLLLPKRRTKRKTTTKYC